jgi:hypothetical protein
MIVQVSDFQGKYTLANTTESYVDEIIQLAIDEYEPELLEELLGSVLYQSLIEGLEDDPVEQKWADLATKVKKSIMCYVYWFYIRDNSTFTTGTGEVRPSNQNSDVVSPNTKTYDRWNEMVKNNFEVIKFIRENPGDYPTVQDDTDLPPFVWEVFKNYSYGCRNDGIFGYRNQLGI